MDFTNPKAFNKVFGHLSVSRDVAENFDHLIGQRVRFHPPKDEAQRRNMGELACNELFEITGVQRDYKGELCYRVRCLAYNDQFGRCAPINAVYPADH